MLVYHLPGTFESREAQLDLLWEAGATGLEERQGMIRAYFEEFCELPELVADGEWLTEPEQDWQAEFKRSLKPVQAGRVTILAPWHAAEPDQLTLTIEPGMAFGTGHHATTRLAVEALSGLELTDKAVLDVGTGSGVLAMAAALLGARFAYGLDIDPQAIPIAQENAQLNGLNPEQVRFEVGTLGLEPGEVPLLEEPFDLLVANLYAELHRALLPEYLKHVHRGSPLLLTGILEAKVSLVQEALLQAACSDVQVKLEDGWALVTARAPR